MLTSLEMSEYRGFGHYRVAGLARVNLLVGRNNCGKTSILEAAHLLASGADPEVLSQIAERRGEVLAGTPVRHGNRVERILTPTCAHFFHGHDFALSSGFLICSDGDGGRRSTHVAVLREIDRTPDQEPGKPTGDRSTGPSLAIINKPEEPKQDIIIPVTEEGALLRSPTARPGRLARAASEDGSPVVFIAPDSLMPTSMSDMWNEVVRERRESAVIGAMRILEPGLEDVFFLSGDAAYSSGGPAGVLVAFRGAQRRVPLGSQGEGMRRMLSLALALIQARGGMLLIDEIDTGLHYSIMGDMWRLVVEAAQRSEVQVFATTHSLDCVRGLAWLCDNYPKLAKEVSVQKIEPTLEESVALDAGEFIVAVDQEIEVR